MITALIVLFILHWIGDFVLQSHKVATEKSKDEVILTWHVLVYTTTVAIGYPLTGVLLNTLFGVWLPSPILWAFAPVTFGLHFITDRFTSRWTAALWKQQRWHDFFVVVGLDQLIHIVSLTLTFFFLLYVS